MPHQFLVQFCAKGMLTVQGALEGRLTESSEGPGSRGPPGRGRGIGCGGCWGPPCWRSWKLLTPALATPTVLPAVAGTAAASGRSWRSEIMVVVDDRGAVIDSIADMACMGPTVGPMAGALAAATAGASAPSGAEAARTKCVP